MLRQAISRVKWQRALALMPQRTVLSNAAFGLEVGGLGRKAREARAMTVLEQVRRSGLEVVAEAADGTEALGLVDGLLVDGQVHRQPDPAITQIRSARTSPAPKTRRL